MQNKNTHHEMQQDGDDLVGMMNQIRNDSEQDVVRLHQQARRMVNWREYVRSRPVVAVGVTMVAGYVLLHRSSRKRSKRSRHSDQPRVVEQPQVVDSKAKVARTSIASGAMALLGSLASQGIKYYALKQLRSSMGFNDDQSKPVNWSDGTASQTHSQVYRNGMRK